MIVIRSKLKEAADKGIGLFADEFIPKGKLWWIEPPEFDKIITQKEWKSYSFLQKEFCEKYTTLQKNGTRYLCVDNARFCNHSDNPNTENIGKDCWALRDIHIGEEITCDYREICEECVKELGFENKE